jgi:hypothetical protein
VFFGVVSTFSVATSWCAGLSVAVSILEFMDNSSPTRVGHPVVAALDAVSEVLEETVGADVWSLSDDDLQATIVGCEVVAARQAAMGLRLVREADARGAKRVEYTVCPITRQ